jgi:hypothetical protein
MVHMRAQLLRAEQEKELMRVKLEEEVAEREKAQKQVEVAKRIMFGAPVAAPDAGSDGGDGPGGGRKGRNSRRETWCPGRSAWEPPLAGGWRAGRGGARPGVGTAALTALHLVPHPCRRAPDPRPHLPSRPQSTRAASAPPLARA